MIYTKLKEDPLNFKLDLDLKDEYEKLIKI